MNFQRIGGGFMAEVCVVSRRAKIPFGKERGQYLQLREETDERFGEENIVVIGDSGQTGYLEPLTVMRLFLWKKAGVIPRCYYWGKNSDSVCLVYFSTSEVSGLLI